MDKKCIMRKPNKNLLMLICVDLDLIYDYEVVNMFLTDYKNEAKYRSSIMILNSVYHNN